MPNDPNAPVIFGPVSNKPTVGSVNSSGNIKTAISEALPAGTNNIGKVDIAASTTIKFGKVVVPTPTSRVRISATSVVLTHGITVRALASNGGLVYVGDVTVTASNGFQLSAGQEIVIAIDNLNKIYIDAATTNEGVTYLAS